jgi:hypothetical protein
MTRPRASGDEGEQIAEFVMKREGWQILGRQVDAAGGHRLDMLAVHPVYGDEWLVEVKTWGTARSGRDTVKKAIADAYDMRVAGETRPVVLWLSHHLDGLLGDMLRRARQQGVFAEVRVLGSYENYR